MNLSAPFIDRPIATTLLMLALVLSGAVAYRLLPVAPLPQVEFPVISVTASLPGASPEVMAATVATPLERQLGRIAGVNELTSWSSQGNTRITLQFDLERDIDSAANDVQAAINAARAQLPTSLPNNPTYRKMNPADAPIMVLALTSSVYGPGQLYDIASTVLAQKLSQVEGVGQVSVGGSSLPAVRVELNPTALNHYGIGLDDVRTALASANANRPKGFLEDSERQWAVYANDQAENADQFRTLVIAYRNNAPVRLADVAEVVDSVQDVRNAGLSNGKPSVILTISREPGANIIETVERVRQLLPFLSASIPAAVNLELMMERTSTIRASLREVEHTLLIATALVVAVVFLFLRNVRATLIPSVAVPVSLVATFGVMYLAGFSLNNLSLMALIVAAGFVVDDAIVVLENISRHIERGMKATEAALLGTREVGFTVLSMSVSLVAVFLPLLFMGGIVGRLFREFAVTLSAAVLVSLVVSLTATPMMCARLLAPRDEHDHGRLYRVSERVFTWLLAGYRDSLAWSLRHGRFMMLLLAATIALNVYLYIAIPKGFIPQQDTGRLMGFIRADQSVSFQAMRQKIADLSEIVRADPAVENVTAFTGGGQRNAGMMFVQLKPLAQRRESSDQVMERLRPKTSDHPGTRLFLSPVQDVRAGGRQASGTYQYTLQGDDVPELRRWTLKLQDALQSAPELTDVDSDQEVRGLETELKIDRPTAARLGVTADAVASALGNAFGQSQVSTIYSERNQYRVVMEVAPQYAQGPEALNGIYARTQAGTLVPLSAFARYELSNTPLSVNHQGQFAATTISFNLASGVPLSQALQAIDETTVRIGLPATIQGGQQATGKVFQQSLDAQPWLIVAALVAVYIVLGILYESLVHPLTILSTLPSAGVGALLALILTGTEFSVVALIGVFLLIGLVKKNAIMMVDFALDAERLKGAAPGQAIFEACLLRFRPIMMTTMAALLGALPLALGSGDGAELRRPLGIAIVGGLIVSQVLTLYTTPVVYLYLDRFRLWALRLRHARTPDTPGAARSA
ncbi:MAG: multidrug efflux RND transporter permease subunit [Burkholderiales bacterium]